LVLLSSWTSTRTRHGPNRTGRGGRTAAFKFYELRDNLPEYLAWIKEDEEAEHTTLMGATTYRLMSGYAAEMPDDPGLVALTELLKVVFSGSPLDLGVNRAR
jgi:hypothetical protein